MLPSVYFVAQAWAAVTFSAFVPCKQEYIRAMNDGPLPGELLFEVLTPLGFHVHVTRAYWEVIITAKHPVMAGRENKVKDAL